jgi:hypothetical protein
MPIDYATSKADKIYQRMLHRVGGESWAEMHNLVPITVNAL